jgi:hypothetical protein
MVPRVTGLPAISCDGGACAQLVPDRENVVGQKVRREKQPCIGRQPLEIELAIE